MRTRNSDKFRMGSARHMRKNQTRVESILWDALRRKSLGVRVRRQYTFQGYVMDFYVHAAKLCIEVDGEMHDAEHDRERDQAMLSGGIKTLRFKENDVIQDVLACYLAIQREINIRIGQK